jgi:hypothetical protein
VAAQGIFRLGSVAGDAAVSSSTADVTFTSDNPSWSGQVPIRTSGTLTVQPSAGRSFSAAFNSSALNYSGITGLTIGNAANTAAVTIGSTTTVAGPITAFGGDINVNGNINTSTGGTAGDVLLKARGSITQAANVSVTTNGGDVIYWANSVGQTSNGSIFLRDGSSISTSGGHLWMGGGSVNTTWNGLTVGDGFAVSGALVQPVCTAACGTITAGIFLEAASLSSGGGHIGLRGRSAGAGYGITTIGNVLLNGGSG